MLPISKFKRDRSREPSGHALKYLCILRVRWDKGKKK